MARLSIGGTCALVLVTVAYAARAQPALDLPALVSEPLVAVRHWSKVPAAVRRSIQRHWDDSAIADPGDSFQQYDFSLLPGEGPPRRLLFAAKASRAWLVCYEHGGEELSEHLAVVPLDADGVPGEPTWFGLTVASDAQSVTDLAALRAAIREGRYWPKKPPYN